MDREFIDRINELARKKKTVGLTEKEQKEQKRLYKIYLKNIRANFKSVVDNTVVEKEDGTRVSLRDFNKTRKH